MKSAVLKGASALVGAAMLTGCVGLTTREHRGYVMDEQLTTGIQVGVDNKQSVEKTLGLPTFQGTFDQNDWYYVSSTSCSTISGRSASRACPAARGSNLPKRRAFA